MSVGRFASHVAGHEIRALEPSSVCACGHPCMPDCGRCAACAERALDRRLELSRGELDTEDER